jgi:hypothetical protein
MMHLEALSHSSAWNMSAANSQRLAAASEMQYLLSASSI